MFARSAEALAWSTTRLYGWVPFQGSSVPSGSLLPVLVSPGLGSREGFLSREGWEWGGVPCSRTANFAASAVALSTIAGTPWGSALSTRYTGSGSGFLVPGFGFWFSVRGCRCFFLFFRGRGRGFVV